MAFIKAWNQLADEIEDYLPEWQQAIDGEDLLMAYRARELVGLVEQVGRILSIPYGLMLNTLDHFEIRPDGRLEVFFLADTRIE